MPDLQRAGTLSMRGERLTLLQGAGSSKSAYGTAFSTVVLYGSLCEIRCALFADDALTVGGAPVVSAGALRSCSFLRDEGERNACGNYEAARPKDPADRLAKKGCGKDCSKYGLEGIKEGAGSCLHKRKSLIPA